jgi:hypothetical protein
MKIKISILILVLVGLVSCSSDDGYNYHYEILPVATYKVPDTFELGKTYSIKLNYLKPTTCYKYSGVYFDKDFSTRTFAIENLVVESPDCKTLEKDTIKTAIDFYVISKETYTFKFYKGKDADGKSVFDSIAIPVK